MYASGVSPELAALVDTLDQLRSAFLRKLAGLSDTEARRSTVPSGTNLAGLLQHLTFIESYWFEQIVSHGRAARGLRSMQVASDTTIRTLRADYQAACKASNAIIDAIGDGSAPVSRNGTTRDLRWAILSVIAETARHAGHADIIREQIDGRTGR
jgi:hypothetical protein